mmetsp:Transcript_14445/g.34602  ORF Transcript_14445/g.34602 Transcript_14445/m.34602 type:complete len:105 (+) Transcript_14445:3-317(+)
MVCSHYKCRCMHSVSGTWQVPYFEAQNDLSVGCRGGNQKRTGRTNHPLLSKSIPFRTCGARPVYSLLIGKRKMFVVDRSIPTNGKERLKKISKSTENKELRHIR